LLKLFEYNSRRAKATTLGNGRWQQQQWWPTKMTTAMAPTVTEMAMDDSEGNGDGNGWQQRNRDEGSDGQWQLQWQWPMATAMAMGDGNGDSVGESNGNGNGNGNSNRDGDGDGIGNCNDNGHGDGNNDKGRVASSCASNVHHCGRGNTLPPPPWIQSTVHSPALCHGGDTANSVCSLLRGGVPDSSPWIVFLLFFTTTVQFTEQPSVPPPHYSKNKNPVTPLMLYLLHSYFIFLQS
jgi:hypothetical protein